jgi:hypothetical protein
MGHWEERVLQSQVYSSQASDVFFAGLTISTGVLCIRTLPKKHSKTSKNPTRQKNCKNKG